MESHENTSPPEGSSPFVAATSPPVEKIVNPNVQAPDDLLTPGPKFVHKNTEKEN